MYIFFFIGLFALLLVIILKIVSYLLAEKTLLLREELSPYECGFEHHTVSRIPFSLRYFLLTLVFLLFDLEIVLLVFVPSFIIVKNNLLILLLVFVFLFVLFIGLLYEWLDGSLE